MHFCYDDTVLFRLVTGTPSGRKEGAMASVVMTLQTKDVFVKAGARFLHGGVFHTADIE